MKVTNEVVEKVDKICDELQCSHSVSMTGGGVSIILYRGGVEFFRTHEYLMIGRCINEIEWEFFYA